MRSSPRSNSGSPESHVVVDRLFAEPDLAGLYDAFCPWEARDDFRFYLPLVMSAQAVLDVGCGTGTLLKRARDAGHSGRLCGLDPAIGMLQQARQRTDVEWIRGSMAAMAWHHEFDLIVMTGHAFQVLVADDEIRASLATLRAALTEDGRFAFETRNPSARAWEAWTPDRAVEAVAPDGAVVRMEHDVDTPVDGDVVSFTITFTCPGWHNSELSRSTLRFLDAHALRAFMVEAGLVIDEQFGDWDGQPLSDSSPEIITIARRA
jgi:SAM-dependent methyltransferase